MTTVCTIQQVPVEGLGLIGQVLKSRGIAIELIRPHKGERVPQSLGHHSGLVILGRPMGVYEQHSYPSLGDEIRLLQNTLEKRKPILGVCLGSQLLAAALGTTVRKGKRKELG